LVPNSYLQKLLYSKVKNILEDEGWNMKIKVATGRISLFSLTIVLASVLGCSGSQQEDVEFLEATESASEEEVPNEVVEEVDEEAAITEPTPVPEAAPTTGSVDKSRVVRYVTADDAVLRGQPNENAELVGRLQKGDMILVVEESGWCKISDNMFIRADQVTSKAVARKRVPASWHKPAH